MILTTFFMYSCRVMLMLSPEIVSVERECCGVHERIEKRNVMKPKF